ncbi:MAG: hypothetical protein ABUL58_04435 [Steroidobacter sp.]
MKVFLKIVTILFLTLQFVPAFADSAADEFGRCMSDALNGKERKQLAKWIFFAMAAHPDIKIYSNITEKDIKVTDEYVGKLVTRLLTENCPDELVKANSTDPNALEKAFEMVGAVAMQELMSNKDVMSSITGYARYTDQDKLTALLKKKIASN